MERDGLVQAVLDGVAAGRHRLALAPTVAQDDRYDGENRERDTHHRDEDLVTRHQNRVQNPA